MPVYEYRCRSCGAMQGVVSTIASYDPEAKPECLACHEPMGRVYDPLPFQLPMEGHWNPTVGRYVSGEADFRSALSAKSDEATERTGIEHRYKPIDLRDREAVGITDGDGLEATVRQRYDDGQKIDPALKKLGL